MDFLCCECRNVFQVSGRPGKVVIGVCLTCLQINFNPVRYNHMIKLEESGNRLIKNDQRRTEDFNY